MTTEITIPSTCHLPAHKRKQAKAAINRAIALASLQAMEGQPMRLEAEVYHGIHVQYELMDKDFRERLEKAAKRTKGRKRMEARQNHSDYRGRNEPRP